MNGKGGIDHSGLAPSYRAVRPWLVSDPIRPSPAEKSRADRSRNRRISDAESAEAEKVGATRDLLAKK